MGNKKSDYEKRFGKILLKAYKAECEKEGLVMTMSREEFHKLIMRSEKMKKNRFSF